jgi:hypothetical protein
MNKLLLATILASFSASADANSKVPIKLEFEIDNAGQKSNAVIIVLSGQKASIDSYDAKNQSYYIEVVPTLGKSDKNFSQVELQIKAVVKSIVNGESRPKSLESKIIASTGKVTSLGGTNDGKNNFVITVKPTLFADN